MKKKYETREIKNSSEKISRQYVIGIRNKKQARQKREMTIEKREKTWNIIVLLK